MAGEDTTSFDSGAFFNTLGTAAVTLGTAAGLASIQSELGQIPSGTRLASLTGTTGTKPGVSNLTIGLVVAAVIGAFFIFK